MYWRYIFAVLFVVIAIFYASNVYQFKETLLQATNVSLQVTMEYLICLQSYVQRQMQAEVVNNSDDLAQYEYDCPKQRYIIRIISQKPTIIYIEEFLTQKEIQHLINLTEQHFTPSTVFEKTGTREQSSYRTSSSAYLERHETPIVKCIEQRFAQFQGNIDVERLEPLQVVKYTSDQQYKPHFDWLWHSDVMNNGGQRISTFFTYLQANCSMGETEFPYIPFNESLHGQFCNILTCDENSSQFGIRFRPLPGNSIFWYNTNELGEVDHLTYHAGRPPGDDGQKIGLNTWIRQEKYII